MKKPWDKGWIPPPKPIRKWEGPATPEGWIRDPRQGCVEFYRVGATMWSYDRILGGPGQKWKLLLNWNQGVFKAPDFTSSSLEALLVWYAVEKENAPQEPAGDFFTVTGRAAGKSAAMPPGYSSARFAVDLGTLIHADFTALERRVCKP